MSKYDGSRGPPDINGMASLKVDNLTYRTTMDDLERQFKKFGEVGDIYIPRDRDTHESRGFAFVRFYEERDADDAMDAMDGKVIDGREIRVAMTRYGRPTNQFDPRRGGGGNRYRGGFRDRGGSSYNRERDSRNSYRERRHSPRKRRSRSRSRSPRKRSRSHSRSPRHHNRSSSRSPKRRSGSPAKSRTISRSKTRSKSRSRSRSIHSKDGE